MVVAGVVVVIVVVAGAAAAVVVIAHRLVLRVGFFGSRISTRVRVIGCFESTLIVSVLNV